MMHASRLDHGRINGLLCKLDTETRLCPHRSTGCAVWFVFDFGMILDGVLGEDSRGCGIALDGLVGCFARWVVVGVAEFVGGMED